MIDLHQPVCLPKDADIEGCSIRGDFSAGDQLWARHSSIQGKFSIGKKEE